MEIEAVNIDDTFVIVVGLQRELINTKKLKHINSVCQTLTTQVYLVVKLYLFRILINMQNPCSYVLYPAILFVFVIHSYSSISVSYRGRCAQTFEIISIFLQFHLKHFCTRKLLQIHSNKITNYSSTLCFY